MRGELGEAWQQLQNLCDNVMLNEDRDRCVWSLAKSGNFTVRSMYLMIKALWIRCPFRKLWFIKIPLKIKVFLWLIFKNSILTKDNLTKRG